MERERGGGETSREPTTIEVLHFQDEASDKTLESNNPVAKERNIKAKTK